MESSHPFLELVASPPPHAASLSLCPFCRHSSTIRAVCVDALVRICAGGDQRWSSLPRQLSNVAVAKQFASLFSSPTPPATPEDFSTPRRRRRASRGQTGRFFACVPPIPPHNLEAQLPKIQKAPKGFEIGRASC